MEPSAPERMSSRELLTELASDAALLIDRQVKLARVELRDELLREAKAASLLGAAAVLGWSALTLALVAAALAIGLVLPAWAGALIVCAIVMLGALALAAFGWSRRVKQALPRTRSEAHKELAWAKTQFKS
jgi:hypothetical protein